MNHKFTGAIVLYSIFAACAIQAQTLDTAKIDAIIGIKGVLNTNEHVFKVTSPRTDVKVSVDGWQMPPFMGLASWAAFTPGMGDELMVMGDTVLFQDEVNPAMSAALDNGLSVTALHNHFFYDEPKVYFMHIGGEGSAQNLADGGKKGLGQDQGSPCGESAAGELVLAAPHCRVQIRSPEKQLKAF